MKDSGVIRENHGIGLLTKRLPIRRILAISYRFTRWKVRMPADVLGLPYCNAAKGRVSPLTSRRTVQSSPSMASEAWSRATEMELIREAQKGSRAAFDTLVRQYDRSVLRLALHLTGSEQDAQDIHQEAFLKAYRYLANFRFECSFYTWIYRIVTNLCLDHLRRRKSRREEQSVILDSGGEEIDLLNSISDSRSMANPERELERKALGKRIQEALDTLTPRERMVFELKHYQGLRLRIIGEMLNTTEETAKNTLFRATKKLRTNLAALR
jgi:RNA polymerase sigma-70 factor, ECF subfamily